MNSARNIREVEQADLDRIREIVSSAIRLCVNDSDEHHESLCKEVFDSIERCMANNSDSLSLVCQRDGRVLGAILVEKLQKITALFVDPDYQREGLGRELINAAIKSCKKRSANKSLKLNSSDNAASFYKKMGFKQTTPRIDKPGGCIPFEYKF